MKPTSLLLVCLFALGCGSHLVKPKGKIVYDGKDYQLGRNEHFEVTFLPHSENGGALEDMFPATVTKEGKFEVPGKTRTGILPGKYRIAVRHVVSRGLSEEDRLRDAFSTGTTQIVRDIQKGMDELILDVSKPTG